MYVETFSLFIRWRTSRLIPWLAVLNRAAIGMNNQVALFWLYMSKSGKTASHGRYIFRFCVTSILFSVMDRPVYTPSDTGWFSYTLISIFYFISFLVLTQGVIKQFWLSWNFLSRPGWPWTHRDSPVSASWVLESKMCDTIVWPTFRLFSGSQLFLRVQMTFQNSFNMHCTEMQNAIMLNIFKTISYSFVFHNFKIPCVFIESML